MVRIDSTGYSTSSKRGSYSESPIMLGSIGGCELSIPIQESLLRVCVYTYIYIFVHACCCLGTSCVQQSSTSAVILIVTAKWVSRVVRPVYRSLTPPFFFSFFFFSLLFSFPWKLRRVDGFIIPPLCFAIKIRRHLHKELNKNHGAVE